MIVSWVVRQCTPKPYSVRLQGKLSDGVRLHAKLHNEVPVVSARTVADTLRDKVKTCVKLTVAVVTDDCLTCLGNL